MLEEIYHALENAGDINCSCILQLPEFLLDLYYTPEASFREFYVTLIRATSQFVALEMTMVFFLFLSQSRP